MTEKEYNRCIGKTLAGKALNEGEMHEFVNILTEFESMLDEAEEDDFFGTEGWRHRMGWD